MSVLSVRKEKTDWELVLVFGSWIAIEAMLLGGCFFTS